MQDNTEKGLPKLQAEIRAGLDAVVVAEPAAGQKLWDYRVIAGPERFQSMLNEVGIDRIVASDRFMDLLW